MTESPAPKLDPNRWVRRLPIAAGILFGTLLMVNRLATPEVTPAQARGDAVGVLACALLVFVGLLWQQVRARSPDAVVLDGEAGFELAEDWPEPARQELAWASQLLLSNTATGSVVVVWRGQTLLRRGVLGPSAAVEPGAILQRVREKGKPVYLVDTKLYPGRFEFSYLPPNVQGIICQPLGSNGALVVGANAPRSYTQQDEAWVAGLADKLAVTLAAAEPSGDRPS